MGVHDGHRIPLPFLPAGIDAWLSGPASTSLRDRRGHLKAQTVDLRPNTPAPVAPEPTSAGLSPVDLAWLLGARSRTTAAWDKRFGPDAQLLVHQLVAHGVVHARHQLTPNLTLGPLLKTLLTPDWQAHAQQRASARQVQTAALATEATELADRLAATGTEQALSSWLHAATRTEPHLLDILAATTDLLADVVHDGPRAFSQHHFGDTKSNDDISSVLRSVGATDRMLEQLGLARAQYVGLAGPILLTIEGAPLDLAGLRGPTMLRTDQQVHPVLTSAVRAVVIVENLQAAETLALTHPNVAVIHTNGQPGDPLLRLIAPLVHQSRAPVHVICDADLGGCRIAQRILTLAPNATVHDIGAYPHTAGRRFAQTSIDGLNGLLASPVAALAQACLARRYIVEQEAATRAAVHDLLGQDD